MQVIYLTKLERMEYVVLMQVWLPRFYQRDIIMLYMLIRMVP